MFRARTGVRGSFGSDTHSAKRLKTNNNARLPNGQFPPMQAVSGDVEMDALPDLSTKYDTVYIGRHEPTLKDDAVFDYLSPWLRQALSSTKIGIVNADSYQSSWHKKAFMRLSQLETGLPSRRTGHFHYCPKGCGLMFEALIQQPFRVLGQQVQNIMSTEVFDISADQVNMISEFYSTTGPFGLEWSELRNVHPPSETGQELLRRALHHIQTNGQLHRLQLQKEAHVMATRSYTPKVPTRDTSGAIDTFLQGGFGDLIDDRTHTKMFIFTLDDVQGNNADAALVAKLKRVRHGMYMLRLCTPEGCEQSTPQDFYMLSRHKFGILEDNNPISRLRSLCDGNPFSLEMLLFDLSSKQLAQASEKFWHKRFALLRVKNEWFFTQKAVGREWFNAMYNFISGVGSSPMNGLTLDNWNDAEREGEDDLELPDRHLFALDAAIRILIPYDDITLPPLRNVKRGVYTNRSNSTLTAKEWTDLLRQFEQICRENQGMTGRSVLNILTTDPKLLFHLGRSNTFVTDQLKRAFPRINVPFKEFVESSTPGQLLFESLSENEYGDSFAHLRWSSLHKNWPLLLSNAHEQWVICKKKKQSVSVM